MKWTNEEARAIGNLMDVLCNCELVSDGVVHDVRWEVFTIEEAMRMRGYAHEWI